MVLMNLADLAEAPARSSLPFPRSFLPPFTLVLIDFGLQFTLHSVRCTASHVYGGLQ